MKSGLTSKFLFCLLLPVLCWSGCRAWAQSAELKAVMEKLLKQESVYSHELDGLDAADLRLLRNAIFAQHGYRFKSADLREYFAQYPWYKPAADEVDALLTPIDKDNIATIRQQEHILKLIAEVSPAPRGDTVTLNPREQELVGMWHESFSVASGYSERYHFFPSRWVIWYANEMDCGKRLLSLRGRWKVEGSLLCIDWRNETVNEGGIMVVAYGTGSCASDSVLEGGEWLEHSLAKPRKESHVLGPVEEAGEEENSLPRITLDQEFYWRMTTDPMQDIY